MSYELTHPQEMTSLHDIKTNVDVYDYADILYQYNLSWSSIDCYLQVGETKRVQGWILHVSVVRGQIPAVLNKLIPLLHNTPFRVVKDKEIARCLLDGNQGPSMVGKVISIFPDTDSEALELAQILINVTVGFVGPAILTDIHLGSLIYTAYGGFNPIFMSDASGKLAAHIFDKNGALVKDIAPIPFQLPEGIVWPFSAITNPVISPAKKIIKGKYLPVKLLKADSKGDVHKALYVNGRLGIHWCVIKQGKQQMWADEEGRDMRTRLAWQKELYRRLGQVVSMPVIIDLFEENGDAYLVQEYVQSQSLMDKIYSLNKGCQSWHSWTSADKSLVLNYLQQVLEMVSHIHRKKIVHRDLTPVNFLARPNGRLVLIDSELAYDLSATIPYRPFVAGTRGFMSPEQSAEQTPTVMEDIYALGAFMLTIFTGLAPLTVGTTDPQPLRKNLSFFLKDERMAQLIASCLRPDPTGRPTLETIQKIVKDYKYSLDAAEQELNNTFEIPSVDQAELRTIINKGIKGLMEEPLAIEDGLWLSRASDTSSAQEKPKDNFSNSGGLYEGISGVLYFLARAKDAGLDISSCQPSYKKGWEYIQQVYLNRLPETPAGLYGGAAGMALAMAMGLKASLIEDTADIRNCIAQCLSLPNKMLDVAAGVAGQGIATIQCRGYLDQKVYHVLLENNVRYLLNHQYRGKYWIFQKGRIGTTHNAIGFSNGNTGITWFLLMYIEQTYDHSVQQVVLQSLQLLHKEARKLIRQVGKHGIRGLISGDIKIFDGLQGLVMVFIKAYEILNDKAFKNIAEELLGLYPMNLAHDNIFQEIGLSGIGELHLEANRALKHSPSKEKADWLVQYFLHTCHVGGNGAYYWVGNNADFPTADFMVGNAGILHFLLRNLSTENVGYRFLK